MGTAGHRYERTAQSADVIVNTGQAEGAAYASAEMESFVKAVVTSSAEEAAYFNKTVAACHANEVGYGFEYDAVVICCSAAQERMDYNGVGGT
ncbi:MAG: hypothetical protein ACKEQI_00485 [Candidatus Hodgkinia cicadicola]